MRHAGKEPVEGDAALALLEGMTDLVVTKGRKVERFDLRGDRPSDADLLAVVLGRSGKLRAPAMRTGATLVVGYNATLLESLFGKGA